MSVVRVLDWLLLFAILLLLPLLAFLLWPLAIQLSESGRFAESVVLVVPLVSVVYLVLVVCVYLFRFFLRRLSFRKAYEESLETLLLLDFLVGPILFCQLLFLFPLLGYLMLWNLYPSEGHIYEPRFALVVFVEGVLLVVRTQVFGEQTSNALVDALRVLVGQKLR